MIRLWLLDRFLNLAGAFLGLFSFAAGVWLFRRYAGRVVFRDVDQVRPNKYDRAATVAANVGRLRHERLRREQEAGR